VQDFLDVDPRFGRRQDLVRLVADAHELGLRVILDVIFNHSGSNWIYPPGTPGGEYRPSYTAGRHPFGQWLGAEGEPVSAVEGREEGVWPSELLSSEAYTRAGCGSLGAGDIDDPEAEHKRTDFETLRDFRVSDSRVLGDLALCYKYWIALTDCDGFRIDTVKHVPLEEARNFCGTIKEFASNLGKKDFFIVGEIAGGDYSQDRYLDVLGRNLNAALDIGEMRLSLTALAKGFIRPDDHFRGFDPGNAVMGSHRNLGGRHVAILDDHDHVFGEKVRFSAEASSPHQVAAGVALQLFTLGIPCIYYGTEQAFSGPEPAERKWLPGWKGSDRYLREAMFGPRNPRKSGSAGLSKRRSALDQTLPGFGPFGTAGHHCFDEQNPAYLRIAALAQARAAFPALRYGRQYLRPIAFLGWGFGVYGPGEIAAWSRILDDEELLCVLNTHGTEIRGADVLVDAQLSPPGTPMAVVLNTAGVSGSHPLGSTVTVRGTADGKAYVEIRDLPPSEVLLLANHPQPEEGGIRG